MRRLFSLLLIGLILSNISCIQINSYGETHFDESKSVQLYIKNFSSVIQNINADLVSDDIKIKGDTRGDTYVIVRVAGDGVSRTGISMDKLQARIDKYYDIQIHQQGDNGLYISVKQKVNNINSDESLSFYFEVHTATSSSVAIKNISGNIDVDRAANADVSSVSGDIELNNISGETKASTTSGNIKGDNIASVNNANTVSGDIKLKINSLQNDATFESTSGNVALQISSATAANIDFSSTSGNVKINSITSTNYSSKKENEAIGTFNNGGKSLSIHTVSGDISIN